MFVGCRNVDEMLRNSILELFNDVLQDGDHYVGCIIQRNGGNVTEIVEIFDDSFYF